MQELDAGVGSILDAVQAAGIADNTLVVFSSDNGAATYAKLSGNINHILLNYFMFLEITMAFIICVE